MPRTPSPRRAARPAVAAAPPPPPVVRVSADAGLQAQKSAATRKALIEATIRCLIRHGYAGTTTPRVAAEAGLSRGAMLHHFENGPALIRAAIGYLHEKRLRAFARAVSTLPEGDHLAGALHGYWKQVTHPLYVAFHELAVASRTDPELAAILKPAQAEFNARWKELAVQLFPEWQADQRNFLIALSLVQNTLDGMALNRLTGTSDPALEEALLAHLEGELRRLRPPSAGKAADAASTPAAEPAA
jgi:AcrR family transcriptional regulator